MTTDSVNSETDVDAAFATAKREAGSMLKSIGWLQPASADGTIEELWQAVNAIATAHCGYGELEAERDAYLKPLRPDLPAHEKLWELFVDLESAYGVAG